MEEIEIAFLLGNASFKISVAAVFFGANAYIGNGPDFMVKAIADQSKVHTPTFLGCVFKYTLPYMVPVLIIVWWFFSEDEIHPSWPRQLRKPATDRRDA